MPHGRIYPRNLHGMTELVRFEEKHVKDAAEAEKICFSLPWSENALKMLVDERGYGVVCLVDGKFAAYGGLLFVDGDSCDLANVATLPEFRRRGLARKILAALFDEATARNIKSVFLEVRASNIAAINLYISDGFQIVGTRKNYYFRPREDAIIMEKKLG